MNEENKEVVISKKESNTFAVLGLVFAFLIPIIGLILSIIGIAGAKNYKSEKKGMAIAGLLISIAFIILSPIIFTGFLGGIISAGSSIENASPSTDSSTTKPAQAPKFSYTVDSQYGDSYGFGTYYIEGTVTNNRDKNYSYLQIEFICYDAAGNNLGTALDNTNNLLGNQTWKYKAMFLGTDVTVDHCDYHDITGW